MIDLSGDDDSAERTRQVAKAFERIADFRRAGQWQRVVDESTLLLNLSPQSSSAYCARGAAYGKLGFFTDSVSDFSQAIRFDPSSYLSFFNRAMAFTRISRYAEAVADLKRVLEIEPTYTRAQQMLAKVEPHVPTSCIPSAPLGLSAPLSSDSSLGSSSSRASSLPKSPSPASVVDTDEQGDALGVLGDLGIIEDEFDISLLAKLFDEEEGGSKCRPTSPLPPVRKSGSAKRSQPPPTSKSKKPRTPPGLEAGSLDSLDAMIDNQVLNKACSQDWALSHDAAAWFTLD